MILQLPSLVTCRYFKMRRSGCHVLVREVHGPLTAWQTALRCGKGSTMDIKAHPILN